MSFSRLTASEMREGLLKGEFSSVDLTKDALSRIESTNEVYNSFVRTSAESAVRDAESADKLIKSNGSSTDLLTGIPVGVKDIILTKGLETTACSKILTGFIPPYDSTVVKKIKKSAGVIVGKTNNDEFCMGSSTESSHYGPTKNPWDVERVPGGTSGGSAAAVTLGQVPIALGTDTGGSVRQPASLCGCVGIKPTYGRVSRYGVIAYASSLEQVGVLSRSVKDSALMLSTIAGACKNDSTSMNVEVPNYYNQLIESSGKGLKGLRVGVPKEYFIDGMQTEVEDEVRRSLKTLEKLGATLVEISLPHTKYALPCYYVLAPAEASSNLARYDGIRYGYRSSEAKSLSEVYQKTRAEGFGSEVKRRILVGSYVLSTGYYDAYYLKAQSVRTLIINDFKQAFNNDCDVIAAPVSPTTAFKIGEKIDSPAQMYLGDVFTITINLAGVPAISVPCGFDKSGLPIGVQFIGPAFSESLLFNVANEFELEEKFPVHEKASV